MTSLVCKILIGLLLHYSVSISSANRFSWTYDQLTSTLESSENLSDDICRPLKTPDMNDDIPNRICNLNGVFNALESEELNIMLDNFGQEVGCSCEELSREKKCLRSPGITKFKGGFNFVLVAIGKMTNMSLKGVNSAYPYRSKLVDVAAQYAEKASKRIRKMKMNYRKRTQKKDNREFDECGDFALMFYSHDEHIVTIKYGSSFLAQSSLKKFQAILETSSEFFGPSRDIARGIRHIIRYHRLTMDGTLKTFDRATAVNYDFYRPGRAAALESDTNTAAATPVRSSTILQIVSVTFVSLLWKPIQ